MDLRQSKKEQLEDLRNWLNEIKDETTPAAIRWDEICLGLKQRAVFLTEFVIPFIEEAPRYTGRIAVYEPAPTLSDTEIKVDDSSAGPAFELPPRG